jgi:hypothetical protein
MLIDERFSLNEELRDIAQPIFYFDANRKVSHVSNAVTTWQDLSGNNFHMSQAVAVSQPTLVLDADGFGNNCVRFDGTNDFMASPSVTPMNTALARNAWTYVAVVKLNDTPGASQAIWSKYVNPAQLGPLGQVTRAGANDLRFGLYSDSAAGSTQYRIYGTNNIFNTLVIGMGSYPGSAAGTLYINNVSDTISVIVSGTGVFAGNTAPLELGRIVVAGSPVQLLSGDLYFVAAFQGALNVAQRQEMVSRLANRFNVSI